jgi:hypothetical protein
MKDMLTSLAHLLTTIAKLPGPGGARAVVELKQRNPRSGCPRIAQQINQAFGTNIDKAVVHRVLAVHYRPSPDDAGPSWLTFLGHSKDSLGSIDLFRCESILLNSHWVLVVMDQFTRRMFGFGVHAGDVDGVALCRMFNYAILSRDARKYPSSDNDLLFQYYQWQANLRILGAYEVKIVPHALQSHPFFERQIGTIRGEYLDHILFWNTQDFEQKLAVFRQYYNRDRADQSPGGDTPAVVSGNPLPLRAKLSNHSWVSHCNGHFQIAIAA